MRTSQAFAASAVIASLFATSAAQADGMEGGLKDAPRAAETYVWDGLYVAFGGGAGSFDHNGSINTSKTKTLEKSHKICKQWSGYYCVDWGWSDWEEKWSSGPKTNSGTFGNDEWDAFGTIQIGYDRLLHDRFLIGAFADVDIYADSDNDYSGKLSHKVSVDGNLELDRVWSVGGRIGFLVHPCILLYGVGGYTEAKLDGSADIEFKQHYGYPTVLTLKAPDEMQGYFVGGGGEIKLTKNVGLKFEYRMADYDTESTSAYGSTTSDPFWCGYGKKCRVRKDFSADADLDAEIHSVRAALVVKFGEPEPTLEPLK
jgi:outer membrane immunogenic protein